MSATFQFFLQYLSKDFFWSSLVNYNLQIVLKMLLLSLISRVYFLVSSDSNTGYNVVLFCGFTSFYNLFRSNDGFSGKSRQVYIIRSSLQSTEKYCEFYVAFNRFRFVTFVFCNGPNL